MFAGIDFGTSNCLLGVWRDGSVELLPLEGERCELPSNLFVSREAASPTVRAAESARVALRRGHPCEFGAAAQEQFMQDPGAGFLIKSPKTFLGSDLRSEQLDFFRDVSATILGFMKSRAEAQLDGSIDSVVLGRPVHFHGTRGSESDQQAEDLLRSAATQVGFKEIEFMLEPVAAALHFEQSLTQDMQVLVLDIGGGTTDCSMIDVGPSHRGQRRERMLGFYAGRRSGGVELDIQLAMLKLMPLLGRGRCEVPDQVYWDAAKVNDIPAQSRFLSAALGHELELRLSRAPAQEKALIRRLIALHSGAETVRLNRSAELAKVQLSTQQRCQLALDYLDDELLVDISRQEFSTAIERDIESFLQLVTEVERQAGTKPDLVYVTGGTAKSPIVQEFLNSNLVGYRVEYGNLFGSVGAGLTTWAGQLFR